MTKYVLVYAKSHDHDVVNLTGPIKARLSHLQPLLAIFEIEGRKLQDKRIFSRKVYHLSTNLFRRKYVIKMSLTVKAFLVKGGNEKAEIRRFTVPQDVSASFDYLQKKIADIFPGLARGNFDLYWKGIFNTNKIYCFNCN